MKLAKVIKIVALLILILTIIYVLISKLNLLTVTKEGDYLVRIGPSRNEIGFKILI